MSIVPEPLERRLFDRADGNKVFDNLSLMGPRAVVARLALLVAVAYFIGGQIDLLVGTMSPAPIWPPNAVLLAVLLATPVRHWWIYVLCVAPADFAISRAMPLVPTGIGLYLSNSSQSLVAAALIRSIWRRPPRWNDLYFITCFIAAAILIGPAVGALLGAATVESSHHFGHYWESWRSWFLANALTNVTLVPALCALVKPAQQILRAPRSHKRVEPAILFAGLVMVCLAVFEFGTPDTAAAHALVYAPLPLLLWAAVRLGPVQSSAAQAMVVLAAIHGAARGHGPFNSDIASANVLHLQLFLLSLSLPLTFLAAVVEREREVGAALLSSELEARLRLSQLSAIYHSAPIGLAFIDSQLRYIRVNNHLAQIHGIPAGSHVGCTIREVLGAEVAKRIEPLIRQVLRSGEPLSEMEISEAVTDSKSKPRVWLISYYPVKVGDGGTATDDGEVQGVIAVVDEITKRKQAEADLRASEKRYRDIVDTQQEMVCRYLPDTTLTFVNEAYCRCFRRTREQLLGRRFLELIPEPARAASLAHVQSLGLEPGQPVEHEVTLPDGSIGWQRWTDTPICGLDNQLLEFQGVGVDITQRKRAEEALQLKEAALKASYDKIMDLAARLIVAQEEERTRIARNLHDDFNQEIAAISISISGLKRRLPEAAAELHEDVGRLQRDVIHLSDEIRHLSHELHPGVLRHAGLVAALRSRVTEFRSQSQIELSLGVEGDFQELPGDVSLCLYRAAQEALRNIDTHSGARSARIELRGGPKELELTIADDGKGFEPEVASATGAGLGLISLEERVRLIGGSLRVDAKPEQGTTLRICVPLGDGHDGHDKHDGHRNI